MDISGHNQKVECIVNYEYLASEPDELTLRVGDTVQEVERLPGGWWRGELHGKQGMFPDNFVTIVKGDDADLPVLRKNGPSGRCRAVFSYQCVNPDELSLNTGDVLEVLGEVEEGWWQGRTRTGKMGVFPSNFVVLLDPPPPAHRPVSQADAPSLPPKPVKEQCRVLFPYTAINEDELTLAEGDIVTLVSRDGPDRGWWRGELRGRVGLFPDNFVSPIPSTADYGEKKPDRPPAIKGTAPVSSKHSEKTSSIKESTLSKTSRVKDDTLSKSVSVVKENSVITHKENVKQEISERTSFDVSNLNEPHSHDSLPKKPPVPLKKSTTPTSTVGGLFSGFKNKMLSEKDKDWTKDKDKEKEPPGSNAPAADRLDGTSASRLSVSPGPTLPSTPSPASPSASDGFDRVERNSILNDPRAARVKAPRRRPPSQPSRDEPSSVGLSNGVEHEGDKTDQMKPKARGWEKQKAPWMEELKLNQAKKTTTISDIGKSKSVSASSHSESSHTQYSLQSKTGSTDRIVECGTEERKRESTHSMEMSKSMSSITNKVTKLETFEELQLRVRESSAEPSAQERRVSQPAAPLTNNTGVNHTGSTIPPPTLPSPTRSPTAAGRTIHAPNEDVIRTVTPTQLLTNEQTLIAQLNSRIANLEKLVEAQNAKFSSAIEDLTTKLLLEAEKRMALQSEVEKLAQCVTQV